VADRGQELRRLEDQWDGGVGHMAWTMVARAEVMCKGRSNVHPPAETVVRKFSAPSHTATSVIFVGAD